jgi:hypothetical protein
MMSLVDLLTKVGLLGSLATRISCLLSAIATDRRLRFAKNSANYCINIYFIVNKCKKYINIGAHNNF